MFSVVLINPNTNAAITSKMVAIARRVASPDMDIRGMTAAFGAPLITTEPELATASQAVQALGTEIGGDVAGVIVSAFGDPGLAELRQELHVPVIGIGEAGMREAAGAGRRFAVVTTTADLVASIDRGAAAMGLAGYAGVVVTAGDPVALTDNASHLEEALAIAIAQAVGERQAEAVVIGGGPLAEAARALKTRFSIPIIAPIPAAVRELAAQLRPQTGHA